MTTILDHLKKTVKEYLKQGDLDQALKAIDGYQDKMHPDDLEEFVNLSGRYFTNEKQNKSGLVTNENYTIQVNIIRESIQSFVSNIKNNKAISTSLHLSESDIVFFNQTYIDPYFKIYYKNLTGPEIERKEKYVDAFNNQSIHEFIHQIIHKKPKSISELKNADAQLIYIEGFPGQGKSTFCRKLYYELECQNKRVVFFPLYRVTNIEDFIKTPFKYVIEKTNKEINSTVLIFDGLSELSWKSASQIQILLDNLIDELLHNYKDTLVLITSRFHIINTNEVDEDKIISLALEPFNNEQKTQWINKFKVAYPESLLNDKAIENLVESTSIISPIIGIPGVLGFLVALEKTKEGQIVYNDEDLVKYLIERNWSNEKIRPIKDVRPEYYLNFYQYFSSAELRTDGVLLSFLKKDTEFNKLVYPHSNSEYPFILPNIFENCFGKGCETAMAVKFFLSTFFFKEKLSEKTSLDEPSIVFLDKSIQGYFLSRFIYNIELKVNFPPIFNKIPEDKNALKTALNIVWRSFVSPGIPQYGLERLIKLTMENKHELINSGRYANLKNALPTIISNQLLYHYKVMEDTPPPIDKCLQGFYDFWKLLKSIDNEDNLIPPESLNGFVQLLRLQRAINHNKLDLSFQNFENANLMGIDLSKSIFTHTSLKRADLKNANLNGTILNYVRAESVIIEDGFLKESSLNDSDFSFAKLARVDLSLSVALGAIFKQADFTAAKMIGADFTGAVFSEAEMARVDLSGAKLIGADLGKVKLVDANITDADLSGAYLGYANLYQSDISNVIVDEDTTFEHVDLRFAKFERVQNITWESLAEKLKKAYSLYMCILHPVVKNIIKQDYPALLLDPESWRTYGEEE